MRIDPAEWKALDLEVHALLGDVPLKDVSVVDLPGGGPGRTIEDLRLLLASLEGGSGNPLVRGLFALRMALGKLFGWDAELKPEQKQQAYSRRLPDSLRARSLRPPGSSDGPFELLYQLDHEMLSEIRNATVHAFSCMVLREQPDGYRFYWGIYVAPVSRLTPFYMALIEPFRRFVVYPSMLRRLRRNWVEHTSA